MVRISGPRARQVAECILQFQKDPEWRPWSAQLAELTDSEGGMVDRVVVSFFERPRSYTAEDSIEISCHGSPVVLQCAVERAVDAGARLAEPGEFTLRAYLNGRIDLPQAEAVRDLIEATTLYQARVAARQVEGSVSRQILPVKESLIELIALLEAGIDFAEDDIDVAPDAELLRRVDAVLEALRRQTASFTYGKLVHSGMTLAIVGRPNVGKSSLFNRLLEQDRAIVTDIPGTTRDLVSEVAAIGGIPVKLVDTAGIRTGEGLVETLGIERSFQAMADADLTIVVTDVSAPLTSEDFTLIEHARNQGRWLLAGNKCDLPRQAELPEGAVAVSALTGEGIEQLRRAVLPHAQENPASGFITSLRHVRLLREAVEHLERARRAIEESIPHEMLLIDLHNGLEAIDGITGATTADDILNRIFSTFCIGK